MEKIEETLKKAAEGISITSNKSSWHSDQIGPGDPDCPHCHGIGYIRDDVPIGHPDFGRLFPCACRFEEIVSAQKTKQLDISSLGQLSDKTFETFHPLGHDGAAPYQREALEFVFENVRKYAESPRGWLLLLGNYGCGKTHLAAAVANYRLSAGSSVVFVNAPDLLDHLRAAFRPGADITYDELFDRVRNTSLLVIDDLGAENPSPWAQEKLYQIFNHRYNALLPTIITSNVELERLDQRIRSRLMDTDLVRKFFIDAPDYRRATSDQTDLSSLELHSFQTFENFESRKGEIFQDHFVLLQQAHDAAIRFAEEPHGWFIITGGHGSGKTHLAAAIANFRVKVRKQPALFITCVDLLDHLRATFSPDSLVKYDKRFSEVKNALLLVLDDLKPNSGSPWAQEKLMQLIDYRYVARLPTVVTLATEKTELGAWFETRLLDPGLSVVCPITAPIYRGGKLAQHKKRSNKPRAR